MRIHRLGDPDVATALRRLIGEEETPPEWVPNPDPTPWRWWRPWRRPGPALIRAPRPAVRTVLVDQVGLHPDDLSLYRDLFAAKVRAGNPRRFEQDPDADPARGHLSFLVKTLRTGAHHFPDLACHDALAFQIVGQSLSRTGNALLSDWYRYSHHGWAYAAAGIDPIEYLTAARREGGADPDGAVAMAALRGIPVPPVRTPSAPRPAVPMTPTVPAHPTVADLAADRTLTALLDEYGAARAVRSVPSLQGLNQQIGDHLTLVGIYPADLTLFADVWLAPTANHDLARTLVDIAATTPNLSVNDAVGFCIANQHTDPPVPTVRVVADWDGVAEHGWVYHAAGITPAEYQDARPDLDGVIAFLALRGVALPPIRTVAWPLSDHPHTL